MPKLPVIRGRQLIRALQRDGWVIERTTAHVLMRHPDRPGALVPVPNHPSETIPIGTLNSILTPAGLSPDRLREVLYGAGSMRYTVGLVPEDGETGRYVANVPAIPGVSPMAPQSLMRW